MGDRLVSLDAFRGLTIAGMIVVNHPGTRDAVYAPLLHARWHGCTPTDLVFPFFLFIMGVAAVFSFSRRAGTGVHRHVMRRSAILFGLGLVLNGLFVAWLAQWINPPARPEDAFSLATLRIPGVLQRIGLVYLAGALVVLHTAPRTQRRVTAALLLGYWAALAWIPVPGQGGASVLEPGRDLGAWIDRTLLGEAHLYRYSRTWDPEGLLSTFPAVATFLCGALAGHWLRTERGGYEKAAGLFFWGTLGVSAGLAWDLVLPINKGLWTSSYVLYTAGWALLILASCHWLADLRGVRGWTPPFVALGLNPITAYVLSQLGASFLRGLDLWDPLYEATLGRVGGPLGSLLFALAYLGVWVALTAALYRKRIVIRI